MEEHEIPSSSEATVSNESAPPPTAKKHRSKAVIILSILIVLVAAAGAGAYWWRNDQATKQHDAEAAKISQLKSQLDDALAVDDTPKSTTTEPTDAAKENIIASITSGNTAALEGYMAESVHVVIAASEGVFDHTPAAAIADLDYISDAVDPWNFALSDATLADYASGDYKAYFKSNSIVGVSADKRVVVFNFNDAGKINGVFMSVSADLL